ncbi:fumarate hydratase subunit beta [Amorphus suaedae]
MSDDALADLPRLTLPLSPETARSLAVGEQYLLDGEITATAGFSTHQRMVAHLERGEPLPVDLAGGAFFHMGSKCRETADGWIPDYVNPTTSTRFDAFMPTIIRRLGLTSLGGKGGLGDDVAPVLAEMGCVYFAMPGGASPLLSRGAERRLETGWDDLIEQFRLSRFRLRDFGPVTVAIDAHGNSMFGDLRQRAEARLPSILADLNAARTASRPAG